MTDCSVGYGEGYVEGYNDGIESTIRAIKQYGVNRYDDHVLAEVYALMKMIKTLKLSKGKLGREDVGKD